MFFVPSPCQSCGRASAPLSTHRPATRSRIVAIPAQCPMISARHSVPPSERKGRSDICQLQRPAMMGESIAQPSIGRPLVSVSGPRYVSCAGTTAAGPSISDTSRIAELIDRVPHRNAQLEGEWSARCHDHRMSVGTQPCPQHSRVPPADQFEDLTNTNVSTSCPYSLRTGGRKWRPFPS